jgi:hypothetical protein
MWKSKTFWTGVVGLIGAAGGYLSGELSPEVAAQMALTALIGIFIRHSVQKAVNTNRML